MHELHKYLNHKSGITFFQTICSHVKMTALAFKISPQTTDTENKETTNQILWGVYTSKLEKLAYS